MKILHVINSLCSGGAEVFVADLLIAQANQPGLEVALLTYAGILDHKGEELASMLSKRGIKQFHLEIRENREKWRVPALFRKCIAGFEPDVIHSHMLQCDLFLVLGMIGFRRKPLLVRTLHDGWRSHMLPPSLQRWLGHRFHKIVGCSKSVMDFGEGVVSADSFVNNGIAIQGDKRQDSQLPERRNEIRESLGLDDSECLLGCVGSLHGSGVSPRKGQDLVILALSQLADERIHVVFLGDGSLRMELESLAKREKVEKQCHFVGITDDVVGYLNAADAFMLPSRSEGLSIATIEAACSGLPLVLSSIPAFQPFASSSTHYFENGNSSDLARIIRTLADDLVSFRELAGGNVPHYKNIFDINRSASEYVGIYKSIKVMNGGRVALANGGN